MLRFAPLSLVIVLLAALLLVALAAGRQAAREAALRRAAARLRRWSTSVQQAPHDPRQWLRTAELAGRAAGDPPRLERVVERFREAAGPLLGRWARHHLDELTAAVSPRSGARARALLCGHLALLGEDPEPAPILFLTVCLLAGDPLVAGSAALLIGDRPEAYPETAVPLATALRDAGPRSARALAWALERVLASHPESIPFLDGDPSAAVRRSALGAAAAVLASPGVPQRPVAAPLRPMVEAGTADPDAGVREVAFEALRFLGAPRGPELWRAGLGDPEERVALAAARSLAAAGNGEAAKLLIGELHGRERRLRSQVLAALSELDLDAAAFRRELAAAEAGARAWALEVLGAVGGRADAGELLAGLDDGEPGVRAAAAAALRRLASRHPGPQPWLPRLFDRWREASDPRLLVALAECLATTGEAGAPEAILARLASVPEAMRERLVEIVARFELFAGDAAP